MYEISISGTAADEDKDDVRAAFEELVRDLRETGQSLTGSLQVGGVGYDVSDVSDEASGADADDGV